MSREYSSFACPGTTVAGTNSILSIRPSSIAAIRTLRANGEAGEYVNFIRKILEIRSKGNFRHPEERALCARLEGWQPPNRHPSRLAKMARPQDDECRRRSGRD